MVDNGGKVPQDIHFLVSVNHMLLPRCMCIFIALSLSLSLCGFFQPSNIGCLLWWFSLIAAPSHRLKTGGGLKLDPRALSSFSLITADLDGISSSCLACLCAKAQGRLGWSIEKFQPAPENSSVSVTWITPLGSRRKISVVYLLVKWRDYTHHKVLVGGSPGGGGSEFPGSTPHPFSLEAWKRRMFQRGQCYGLWG